MLLSAQNACRREPAHPEPKHLLRRLDISTDALPGATGRPHSGGRPFAFRIDAVQAEMARQDLRPKPDDDTMPLRSHRR